MKITGWWIPCDCGSEVLHIEHDDEEGIDLSYLSMYEYGISTGKRNWKYRLRLIWKILKDGHPYSDSICLNDIGREQVIDALIAGRKITSRITTAIYTG